MRSINKDIVFSPRIQVSTCLWREAHGHFLPHETQACFSKAMSNQAHAVCSVSLIQQWHVHNYSCGVVAVTSPSQHVY